MRTCTLLNALVAGLTAAAAATALAQGRPPAQRMGDGGGGSGERAFLFSLPVVSMSGETLGHMEFNLGGQGALGIEGGVQKKFENIGKKEQELTGESLVSSARSAGVLVSRYTEPAAMGGFYWTLGVGYREEDVKWSVAPAADDKKVDMRLVDTQTNRLSHDATMKGATGTGRVGYRYVGTDIPMVVGLYLGVRHFQATVKDVEHKAADGTDDAGTGEETVTYAQLTDLEKGRLQRMFMTSPQAALEIGFVF